MATHLHLVSPLRMSRTIPHFPLSGLMACAGNSLPLFSFVIQRQVNLTTYPYGWIVPHKKHIKLCYNESNVTCAEHTIQHTGRQKNQRILTTGVKRVQDEYTYWHFLQYAEHHNVMWGIFTHGSWMNWRYKCVWKVYKLYPEDTKRNSQTSVQ